MRVVGQDVGLGADGGRAGDPPAGQVEGEQGGVAVAGDEGEPVGAVEGEAVIVVAARQRDAAGDRAGEWVDHGELVAGLHVDEHLPCGRVVGHVACLPAELYRSPGRAGGGVDDGL